jgi:hypothetical protein
MATPTNTSGKLQVTAGSGTTQTLNAGFTFTAGRQAVLVGSFYSSNSGPTAVTIGGTAATKRVGVGSGDTSEIWEVLGGGVAGGTANVVLTFPGGTIDEYCTFGVDEWAASSLTYDTSTSNTKQSSAVTSESISTGAALSTTSSIVYSCINPHGINSPCAITPPGSWTETFDEPDNSLEGGWGGWHEETTTGIKTAAYSLASSNNTDSTIAGYILSGGGGGGSPTAGRMTLLGVGR